MPALNEDSVTAFDDLRVPLREAAQAGLEKKSKNRFIAKASGSIQKGRICFIINFIFFLFFFL